MAEDLVRVSAGLLVSLATVFRVATSDTYSRPLSQKNIACRWRGEASAGRGTCGDCGAAPGRRCEKPVLDGRLLTGLSVKEAAVEHLELDARAAAGDKQAAAQLAGHTSTSSHTACGARGTNLLGDGCAVDEEAPGVQAALARPAAGAEIPEFRCAPNGRLVVRCGLGTDGGPGTSGGG